MLQCWSTSFRKQDTPKNNMPFVYPINDMDVASNTSGIKTDVHGLFSPLIQRARCFMGMIMESIHRRINFSNEDVWHYYNFKRVGLMLVFGLKRETVSIVTQKVIEPAFIGMHMCEDYDPR